MNGQVHSTTEPAVYVTDMPQTLAGGRRIDVLPLINQIPTIPPSFLVMTMVAERGRLVPACPDCDAGQLDVMLPTLPFSPGC
jgi:hypothetical protein